MNNYEIKFTYITSKYIKQYIKPILLFILFTGVSAPVCASFRVIPCPCFRRVPDACMYRLRLFFGQDVF